MLRPSARFRIDDRGQLEIIDPCLGDVSLLQAIDPDFVVSTAPLPGFIRPRLHRLRASGVGIATEQLRMCDLSQLWEIHESGIDVLRERSSPSRKPREASILDLKIEIARKLLQHCTLCAHRCGVDRLTDGRGVCRLGSGAIVAEHFVHVGEEPQINPSYVLNLAGCGLRCRFCQQGTLLDPLRQAGVALEPETWEDIQPAEARSLSFAGGNPDESLYAILRFLASAPDDWPLPIVWNTHAYSSLEALKLLDGVVDAYLPDLKYGDERCGRLLSGAPGYPAVAVDAIRTMLRQGVPVIVRVLVLPGHEECCHIPALNRLEKIAADGNLLLSVRGQYAPDWKITERDGMLARRVQESEVEKIRQRAAKLGLSPVEPANGR